MTKMPELIKADLGAYAGSIYKFTLFDNGEKYMEDKNGNNVLKFLHFNNDEALKKMSNKQRRLNRSRTIAVLAVSPREIAKTAQSFAALGKDEDLYLQVTLGIAVASLEDNYSRETGRTQSVRSMDDVNLKVVGLTMNETHTFIHFHEYEGVSLSLRANRQTGFTTAVGKMKK